jgi:hypothetical protein
MPAGPTFAAVHVGFLLVPIDDDDCPSTVTERANSFWPQLRGDRDSIVTANDGNESIDGCLHGMRRTIESAYG